ncbi:MAG TPA: HEAT repeat domain-containing protein [Solirubrobacteraceae bacterium]|nr:HEAT repeat domain-containing protein [Solirubrobacteraceae bacterium]
MADVRYGLSTGSADGQDATYPTIIDLANAHREPLVVTGEPGSGKTTLLTALADYAEREEGRLFSLQPLGLWEDGTSLESLIGMGILGADAVREALRAGGRLVILDAIDEALQHQAEAALEELIQFIERYPGNQYVLSCRTALLPPWASVALKQAKVLPVSDTEIKRQLQRVAAQTTVDHDPYSDLHARLKELCHNPLLLAMTLNLYEEGGPTSLNDVTSRARLYQSFLDRVDFREEAKRRLAHERRVLTAGARQEVLSYVGHRMHLSGEVYVTAAALEQWIADGLAAHLWDPWWTTPDRPSAGGIFAALVSRPPIKGVVQREDESPRHGFLHPTFGDLFAAKYAVQTATDVAGATEALVAPLSKSNWEIVTDLCGLATEPEAVTRAIIRVANVERRQELLRLAANCVRDCWALPLREADDVRLRILDAFKYWETPFDYDLMRAVKGTLHMTGPAFPRRLEEDIEWFVEKYAVVVPRDLPGLSTAELERLISDPDEDLAIDAAYTLGSKTDSNTAERAHVGDLLIQAVDATTGLRHEQLVAALKELGVPAAAPTFLRIIEDPAERPRARAYALNGLGSLGALEHADAVIDYMRSHANPYRDSASWSLQALARRAKEQDGTLFERIKQAYIEALEAETSDREGRYAKGNMLYSLGVLGATEFVDRVVAIIDASHEPYVIEDGVNAAGLLGGAAAGELATGLLDSPDPVVRMKAAEATARLRAESAVPKLQDMLSNPNEYPIVLESVASALRVLESGGQPREREILQALGDARRGPRGDRVFRLTDGAKERFAELADELERRGELVTRPNYVRAGAGWEVTVTTDCAATCARHLAER